MRVLNKALFILILSFAFWVEVKAQNNAQGIVEFKDLSYLNQLESRSDSLQMLNLVLPETGNNHPLFIWIGGGAWSYVNRDIEMDFARQIAQSGIAVASIGHRLSPATWVDPSLDKGIQHPAHIQDVASAVKWLYDHAADYDYSRQKLFIGGFSSGAHLAALLCMDHTYLASKGLSAEIFQGLIPISGAYDIPDYFNTISNSSNPELGDLHVKAVFGRTHEDFVKASPSTYLANLSTPLLLMSDYNMFNYNKLFENMLKKTDFNEFEVVYVPNLSHSELWRDLSFNPESTYRAKVVSFIQKRSK